MRVDVERGKAVEARTSSHTTSADSSAHCPRAGPGWMACLVGRFLVRDGLSALPPGPLAGSGDGVHASRQDGMLVLWFLVVQG